MGDLDCSGELKLATVNNSHFESVALDLCPQLNTWKRTPLAIVKFVPETKDYFGLRKLAAHEPIEQLPSLAWGTGEGFVLDFGIHMVGFLAIHIKPIGAHMDAPCRIRLTFGESPFDVTLGMDNVKSELSTSWLPDEIINVDQCPTTLRIPRRHAFQYLRVEIMAASSRVKVAFSEVECECVSAVEPGDRIEGVLFQDALLQGIDQVSINTLRDCMQTVFENGPRRDRRLWLGDLRLQALANYVTFKDFSLVKRCLYMFAAFAQEDGSLPACVFEKPSLGPSTDYIVDYDCLFAACLYDYVAASGDKDTGNELWATLLGSLKRALAFLDPETHRCDASRSSGWIFIDGTPNLDRSAALHGVLIYSLKKTRKLAGLLCKADPYEDTVAKMSAATSGFLFGEGDEVVFVSGPENEISYASATWLVLAEALPFDLAKRAFVNTCAHEETVHPQTPYLWHYICDALITLECYELCVDIIKIYWGRMVRAGASTFWETFSLEDEKASPHGDVRNNSFCHGWSCTPTYFLRVLLHDYLGASRGGPIEMVELDNLWLKKARKQVATTS